MRLVLVTLSTATGVLVGVRAIFALTLAGGVALLEPTLLPAESLGISWSELMVTPRQMQLLGTERLLRVLAALGASAVTVGALNVVTLLAEAASARRHDIAVRLALGAGPTGLVRALLRELRVLVAGGLSLGVVAGLGAGTLLRVTWPGAAGNPASQGPWDLAAALAVLVLALCVSHVGAAVRMIRSRALGHRLRSTSRTGWDPGAIFARRLVSAVHVAVTGAILVTAWALSSAYAPGSAHAEDFEDDAFVLSGSVDDPTEWARLRAELASIPGLEAESLSAPGALEGLGIRDIAITECGPCTLGGLPMPLWNARAEYHAVSDGFFDFLGLDVVEGRALSPRDAAGAPLVALVSRRLAREAFEGGHALGKRLRIGNDFSTWYRVVGVVEDRDVPNLGEDGLPRGAVYLSALQRPPVSARILLRGDATSVEAAAGRLLAAGVLGSAPVPLEEYMASASAPLRWSAMLLRMLGLLAAGLAAHGIYVTALFTTRRRARDIAVRAAVGASRVAIARFVLLERYRTTAWGLAGCAFLGTLASAPLQRAGGVPAAGPMAYVVLAALTFVLVTAASVSAVREALAVEPARLLD